MRTDYAAHDRAYRNKRERGADGWDESPDENRKTQAVAARLLAASAVPAGARVLEIGCGAGNMTVWLAEQGYETSGVDLAPTALAWAKERAAKSGVAVDFRLGSVLDLEGFEDGRFDAVLDGHCLHCIIGEDRGRCLRSALRVLKPGGAFLVNTMVLCDETRALKGFDPATGIIMVGDIATRYIGSGESIVAEIRDAGFLVEEAITDPGEGFYVRARKPGP